MTIACPASIATQSLDGRALPITYPAPGLGGGQPPVISSCAPLSGSLFSIGTGTVRCVASDDLGQATSCAFSVIVLPPPKLSVTTFLAFGDSLTAGVTSQSTQSASQLEPTKAYPPKLGLRLGQAYLTQSFAVSNAGKMGELATNAAPRFQSELARLRPEVVLLMEGTNDLSDPDATASTALAALEAMVMTAKAMRVAPMLATIPPVRPLPGLGTLASLVPIFNDTVRALAARQEIPLIDVYTALSQGTCPTQPAVFGPSRWGPSKRSLQRFVGTIPCIGDDDIHPTEAGYDVVANAFFERIVALYDVPVSQMSAMPSAGRSEAAVAGAGVSGTTSRKGPAQ